jgi:hypothetical protein
MAAIIASPSTETARDIATWRDNSGDRATIFGTNNALYYMSTANVVTTVTPIGFVTGVNSPALQVGYGQGLYGLGTYGTPRTGLGVSETPVARVMMSAWGEDLIITQTTAGEIWDYTPGDAAAVVITNAPTDVVGAIVTPQRFIMAIGATADARQVTWCDKENNTVWTPTVSNEAGSIVLEGDGSLMSLANVMEQTLILSETDAHIVRYLGPPYVYGFDRLATDCGVVASQALAVAGSKAFWLGERNFWVYDGAVSPLPCEVMDFFFHDKNPLMDSKISTMVVGEHTEIWWLYQSSTGDDVDSYISFNYMANHWNVGTLDRVSGKGAGALASSIMVDSNAFVYNHELHGVAVSGAFAESGPLELQNGNMESAIRAIFPDTKASGDVSVTLKGRSMPTEPDFSYGPYTLTNPTPTRAIGREIRLRVDAADNADWEVGAMRMDISTVGGFR